MKSIIFCFLVLLIGSCKSTEPIENVDYSSDFTAGTDGWKGFFSDYPTGSEEFYELTFVWSALPDPLDTSIRAVKISGNNHSDDLLSFIYRKFEGFYPETEYLVTFDIDLASNTPTNAFGVGGDPNLAFGAGGIAFAPENQIDDEGHYHPNFQSFLQSGQSSAAVQVLGRIGVSDSIPTPFLMINRSNFTKPVSLKTNKSGELWLLIGTDSGFEATTTLYYRSIKIRIVEKSA